MLFWMMDGWCWLLRQCVVILLGHLSLPYWIEQTAEFFAFCAGGGSIALDKSDATGNEEIKYLKKIEDICKILSICEFQPGMVNFNRKNTRSAVLSQM
jgi:hypothetical protein